MKQHIRVAVLGARASTARLLGGLGGHELQFASAAPNRPRCDLVHVCGPAPAARAGLLTAHRAGAPLLASFHPSLDRAVYARCSVVFSPGPAADAALERAGVPASRIVRWEPGAAPAGVRAAAAPAHGRFTVLTPAPRGDADDPNTDANDPNADADAGGHALLSDALAIARGRDPRLWLVRGEEYAAAGLFVHASTTEPFGLEILEAQAHGVPVIAIDSPRAAELIESGRSGCLIPADPDALACAIRSLARRATLRARLAAGGLIAVRERGVERSLRQLAEGYALALGRLSLPAVQSRAA